MTSEVASMKPNPYIFNIENRRRRKPRLAHEIGEGAKCKKCEDKCAGFQLHFWRKICINCHCGKDDHEVEDDDEDIGQILIGKLFERPIRTKEEEQLYSYGTNLDMTNETTGKTEKVAFDWVPPGVAKDIAKKYMEQLPVEKRPIAGSEAAKKRKRQLEQQLPLYDVDENERCENMAPQEYQNFQKYLKILRTKVAGQAKIQEIVALAPKQFSYTLGDATAMDDLPPPPPSNLDFPSDVPSSLPTPPLPPPPMDGFNFDPPDIRRFPPPGSIETLENNLNNNASKQPWTRSGIHPNKDALGMVVGGGGAKPLYGRSQHPLSSEVIRDAANAMGELSLCNKNAYPLPAEAAHLPTEEANLPTRGAAIPSRYDPQNANAQKENAPDSTPTPLELQKNLDALHPSKRPMSDKSAQTNTYANAPNFKPPAVPEPRSAWERSSGSAPPCPTVAFQPRASREGTGSSKDEQAFTVGQGAVPQTGVPTEKLHGNEPKGSHDVSARQLPSLVARESRVPLVDAKQAAYGHQKDKIRGLGKEAHSDDVSVLFPSESRVLGGHTLSPPKDGESVSGSSTFACQYCEGPLLAGDVAVICERAGPDKYWHPSCFVCATCNELLADLIYFFKDGQVYCGRHYNEAASMPRCHACDELIFGETWTKADGFDWHINHFCCFVCDEPLGGSKYIPDEKGFPHCISCYMTFLAKMCEFCEEKISPDQPRTGYRGYFYHAQPRCFCCFKCRRSLMGQRFKMAKNWVFCSQDCINLCAQEIASNPNPKEKNAA